MAEVEEGSNGFGGPNQPTHEDLKIFYDCIHGVLEVNSACLAVINTPEFQRLRFIKQMGLCYYVYPAACHSRFEHSLGVSHLAGKMVRSLKTKQTELNIMDRDILCVELAGLCHDLGHGPFSHLFDGMFLPKVNGNMDLKHEDVSIAMLDHLISKNGLMEENGAFTTLKFDDEEDGDGLNDTDILFIKELIHPALYDENKKYPYDIDSNIVSRDTWPFQGRGFDKSFLYEIVSNKITGIDVDKWDYFARDCLQLGNINNFSHNRYMKFARVIKVDGLMQICAREKEIDSLFHMYYTRYDLHKSACHHQVSSACELMAVDILAKANKHITFPGEDGKMIKLSKCIKDMAAFSQTTDNIMWDIYISQKQDLQPAKKLVERLYKRDLYKFLDSKDLSEEFQTRLGEHQIVTMKELHNEMVDKSREYGNPVEKSQFVLHVIDFDFGQNDKNPLERMRYYTKSNPNTPVKVNEAGLLTPVRYRHTVLRLYSRVSSEDPLVEQINKRLKETFDRLKL